LGTSTMILVSVSFVNSRRRSPRIFGGATITVERAGQGNLIDPVRDRSSETFLFEFVPVRLSKGAANLADAGIGAPWSVAALFT